MGKRRHQKKIIQTVQDDVASKLWTQEAEKFPPVLKSHLGLLGKGLELKEKEKDNLGLEINLEFTEYAHNRNHFNP